MGLNNPACPDTRGAHTRAFVGAVDNNPNLLEVWIPAPFRDVMSMAHVVAKQGTFSTNITACRHDNLHEDHSKNTEL